MAMLDYSEIVLRKFIVLDGEPWEVLDSHVFRKQQRKPVNATKLKNLITGKVTERSFHVSEKVPEAEIDEKEAKLNTENRLSWSRSPAGQLFVFLYFPPFLSQPFLTAASEPEL